MDSESTFGNATTYPTPQDQTTCVRLRASSFDRESLSTDSMVTVRLSDATISPAMIDASTHNEVVADFPNYEDLNALEDGDSTINRDRNGVSFSKDADYIERAHRASTASMPSILEDETLDSRSSTFRSRSDSSGTLSSAGSGHVDWEELEKSEEQAPRDEGSDESTAFLLARLEQENNALAKDPKAALARARSTRNRSKSRPPSIQQLKRLVNEPAAPSLRYSMIPEPPPMTELEFWAALVLDYPQTVQRLPTLTSNKIRGGIPPPLRGVVWVSIAGARDRLLEEEYDRLCGESSPYENLIGKDIGRSFPNVEMFRDPSGDGQKMLGRVLKCFSLYDHKIGYCQGLGFVVGPLLMHMGDKEAFCVLVRLMEHYDLRSCFLPDLSGLHLRIYQFQHLLSQHLPKLTAHLEALQVEPLYVSQWFLSFFAVTCPLPMLLRIYDVILTEGASETLMRVALSLMRRNEAKILGCTEFEDVMSLLLSRGLWDTYGSNADDLVNDFVGLTGLVSRESLENLEGAFKEIQTEDSVARSSVPSVQAAASRFLGRFMTGSSSSPKVTSPTSSLSVTAPSRPSSFLRRTPSKQSMASTLNSIESSESHLSTTSTEATAMSRNQSADCTPVKHSFLVASTASSSVGVSNMDKNLHNQIEDLLTALSDMQREQALLASELQKEREEREEDRAAVQRFLEQAKKSTALEAISEDHAQQVLEPTTTSDIPPVSRENEDYMSELAQHFAVSITKRSSILLSKHQMREDVKLWKDQYEVEVTRSAELLRQLTDQETENARLLEQFRETRSRMQEAHMDKQRLEKTVQDFKSRRSSYDVVIEAASPAADSPGGLREFKLGRSGSFRSQATPAFSKRSSSLGIQAVLATEDHKPPAEDALLLELVNAKTAEAVARQELEEVKGKLDSLRRLMGGTIPSPTGSGHRPSPSEPCIVKPTSIGASNTSGPMARQARDGLKVTPPATSGGGFFSGWGKRTPSNPVLIAGSSEA